RGIWIEALRQVERRAELRQRVEAGVTARVFVRGDRSLAALGIFDGYWGQLGVEAAGVDCRNGLLVTLERERVLVVAAHVLLDRDAFGVRAHVAVVDGAPQPIEDGRVAHRRVPEAVSE